MYYSLCALVNGRHQLPCPVVSAVQAASSPPVTAASSPVDQAARCAAHARARVSLSTAAPAHALLALALSSPRAPMPPRDSAHPLVLASDFRSLPLDLAPIKLPLLPLELLTSPLGALVSPQAKAAPFPVSAAATSTVLPRLRPFSGAATTVTVSLGLPGVPPPKPPRLLPPVAAAFAVLLRLRPHLQPHPPPPTALPRPPRLAR